MDIIPITSDYAVSPQITAEDVPALKAAGYTTVICNRPDSEVGADLSADALRAAVEAAGMTFVNNPVDGRAMTMDMVTAQAAALEAADGPVFAYCRTGNRCSIMWALSQAGAQDTDAILAATGKAGFALDHLRAQIDALASAT